MKAAFPGSLLVAPLSLYLAHKQLPIDIKVTPLAGPQDLPGSWPLHTLNMMTVNIGGGVRHCNGEVGWAREGGGGDGDSCWL
jgi:hypothetical protein